MSPTRPPIPFGKYLLLERVSVGGMAEVFRAKSFGVEGFEKLLAIKRILPSMAEDQDFIEMFIDEAKICGQLSHANICQIFEFGRVSESHFIAMEYVWGKDLLQIQNRFRKQRGKMMPAMAAYVVSKMCEGLDYAHKKKDADGRPLGIIHRDISPQNILVSYDGDIKIIDFGIAKAASRASRTQAGVLKGKFGYMSPEQVRGLPVDRRSDVFAIGTILFELLTSQRLFLGESDFETLEKVRNVEMVRPSKASPSIGPELERIILKALARDAEDRYQWAGDMLHDLRGYLLAQESMFTAKQLAAWMRAQFSAELSRERATIEEQQRQLAGDTASGPTRLPSLRLSSPAGLPVEPPVRPGDETPGEDLDAKTKLTMPSFEVSLDDDLGGDDLDQPPTLLLLDGQGPPGRAARPAGPAPLPSGPTVILDGPTLPPSTGRAVYGIAPSYAGGALTPHAGQLMPPLDPPRAPRSTLWKDVLIGIAVAVAVVGGVVGTRTYLAQREAKGTLVVLGPARATVLVDGVVRGQLEPGLPLKVRSVAAGVRSVVLRGRDGAEFRQSVGIQSGDVAILNAPALGAAPAVGTGRLRLKVSPPGVSVDVDGAQLSDGAATAPIPLRAEVPHELRVTKDGYVEQRFTLALKTGEEVTRELVLYPAPARIQITSDPSGAEVQWNGRRVGLSPVSVTEQDTSRPSRLVVRSRGYAPITRTVSYDKGLDQSLDLKLVPSSQDGFDEREPQGSGAEQGGAGRSEGASPQSALARDKAGPPKGEEVFRGDGLAPVAGLGAIGADKAEQGYLVANTQPWAKVIIDGNDTGRTTPIAPRSKIPLKPGKHQVTFVVNGKKYNFDVLIKPAEDTRLIKQLTRPR